MVVLSPDVSRTGVQEGMDAVGGLVGLARAVVSSPAWSTLGAVLVVRREPKPLLGIVGRFDEAARARVMMLQRQLDHVLPRILLLTYADVEVAVGRLADAMIARFGYPACRRFRYRAIPRGGHIVLGLLAYALGLDQGRLEEAADTSGAEVFVDDCALSGRRFEVALDARPVGTSVILATLFSTPELRCAVERHPRVRACLSAFDLRDAAPQRQGASYGAWQARGREINERGFWRGQVQHVCFPWNEPDTGFWNDVTKRAERGWRLVPPERCAKHRVHGEGDADLMEIQVQVPGPGPIHPHEDVLAATYEDRVVLGSARWQGCVALGGIGAAMWRALIAHGTVTGAARELTASYDVEPARLEADLRAVVAALVRRGALRT